MARRILSLTLLLLIMSLSGCSYRYDFVVINYSNQAIQVQYKLKRDTQGTPGKYVEISTPAKVALSEFQKAEYQWQDLAEEQYQFDSVGGTLNVTVLPDEVLRVDHITNYRGYENQFAIASIRIDGGSGSIDLRGRQAQTQFKPEGDTKYILRYR